MSVPFTQYLMPDGRKTDIVIDLAPDVETRAHMIIDAGFRFECEMLSDYKTCSFSIYDSRKDKDVEICLCPNGPLVPKVITEMINSFNSKLFGNLNDKPLR